MIRPSGSFLVLSLLAGLGISIAVAASRQESKDGAFQPAPLGQPRGRSEPAESAQPDSPKTDRSDFTKTAGFVPSKTIPEMLGPGDGDIEFTAVSVHDARDTPDPIAELESLTRAVPAVAVVKAADIPGRLDKTGMKISSVLNGTVTEVLKNQTSIPIQVGAGLLLPIDGGVTLISGRRVGYRLEWAVLPKVGGTYLVFLFEEQGRLYPRGLDETFELSDGKIRRVHQDGEWGLGGTLDAATSLTIVRTSARQLVVK